MVKLLSRPMQLTSPVFQHNTRIPSKYTCDGENINPPLEFSDVSESAKSLVLIMDDPDAPMGTWVHWAIFNMDPLTRMINGDEKPSGIEGMTSFGKPGYGGPCPPSSTHRYFFKLYALDISFETSSVLDKKTIEEKMQNHILEKAELVGLYGR